MKMFQVYDVLNHWAFAELSKLAVDVQVYEYVDEIYSLF